MIVEPFTILIKLLLTRSPDIRFSWLSIVIGLVNVTDEPMALRSIVRVPSVIGKAFNLSIRLLLVESEITNVEVDVPSNMPLLVITFPETVRLRSGGINSRPLSRTKDPLITTLVATVTPEGLSMMVCVPLDDATPAFPRNCGNIPLYTTLLPVRNDRPETVVRTLPPVVVF